MKNNLKFKKGDISLLLTLLVCFTVLILLTPIAQKVSVESRISKENLMSQQAVQAAKTGLDAWIYKLNNNVTLDLKIPNSLANPINIETTDLDTSLGIQYEVKYYPKVNNNPAYIVSIGKVTRGGVIIERVLEEKFSPI